MSISFTFSACSFFYVFLLAIVFFSKKRLNTIENKIYGMLIICSLCGVVLAVSCYLVTSCYEKIPIISMIISKGLLIYYLLYLGILTAYIYVISNKINYDGINRKDRNAFRLGIYSFTIMALIVFAFPLYFHTENNAYYTYGPSANLVYLFSGVMLVIWLMLMISNYKELKNKKYLPMFAFILLGSVVMVIQKLNPGLLLLTSMEAFVTFLMYFTIENPDMKLIKELNIARDQAEKANNAKTEFLSSMSHEIRTPLNAIVGFSQSLATDETLPEDAKGQIKDILMASDNLLDIVNGILDISKIEANKLEIINTEYEFKKIVEELMILTKTKIGEKPIELRVSIDPGIPPVMYGDHIRLKQVILNLLTNAAKYTNEGWIEFKVNCVKKDDVCRLIISVEDTGRGIKPENIDKLFTKFERLQIEKSSSVEGTGLGLAITKRLTELMGGKIVVQSIYEKGSKFTIGLDQRIVAKTSLETVKKTTGKLTCSNKKVLVVDDNTLNLKVAERLLKTYGLIIDTIDSGEKAIDKIRKGDSYDLILMDDMMPHLSGTNTLKKLKENPNFQIPTVALTANAISGMREKYISEGFDDYLAKPINKQELEEILNKFLN